MDVLFFTFLFFCKINIFQYLPEQNFFFKIFIKTSISDKNLNFCSFKENLIKKHQFLGSAGIEDTTKKKILRNKKKLFNNLCLTQRQFLQNLELIILFGFQSRFF